ncbi:acyl-CoA thioesterase [Maritimibacter sp. UBA3975]|uniref:acyl-CoA thioesterase n=1 Tax=Maritimibacter sp. UBA3975 TaxID=1946833 RepID=UPI000C0A7BEC|nr:acyl-CoA thioesterase [Maritimibacter sp. UBA3975]MAM63668.1 thioeseterase [Maritimibacter sp.]|tara:strand:- start:13057 stop:13590 length:534 start_codon:yes stop_codon:yes gene_type:complete
MYPFIRLAKEIIKALRQPPLPIDGVHVSHHLCWPWDLDMWMELNNGRTLTLFDLGRVPFGIRAGIARTLREQRWGGAVAGASVMYRRRVRMFDRIELRTRLIGWDDKFTYTEQSMWTRGTCANHILVRAATTDKNGIVRNDRVLAAMGFPDAKSPPLPNWVAGWIEADTHRPWPPDF